jgi:[amino group carrier protein]-6-phospho-L-2-aminoadipate/5-phospho-L-glutamate reductase
VSAVQAAIVGGSGYVGGELVRLLLGHPRVEVAQVTSDRLAGQPVSEAHPNLRRRTNLRFVRHEEVEPCDALLLAMPHGTAMRMLPRWLPLAPRIFDLSADFRLRSPRVYEAYYGTSHDRPEWLGRFVPGIPEIFRDELRHATHVSVPGCMATAALLALHPVAAEGLVGGEVVIDARTGSSGSGRESRAANVHAERSGAMRVFSPTGHRHEAEVSQLCSVPVRMTATGVEAVRGVQTVLHVPAARRCEEKEIWTIYRRYYGDEPFVRLMSQRVGLYRLPEPKILCGSNYCDVGFAISGDGCHLVLVSALDNLVKGGAGNAVQCLNIACGWDEREGLDFAGLHPV